MLVSLRVRDHHAGSGASTSEDTPTGLLAWLFGSPTSRREPHARPLAELANEPDAEFFVCSSCGRTDLPEAGDWSPPICEECDAALNFDALEEQEYAEDV